MWINCRGDRAVSLFVSWFRLPFCMYVRIYFNYKKNKWCVQGSRAYNMVQQGNVLATKPCSLSSSSEKPCMVEGQNYLLNVFLWRPHMYCGAHVRACTNTLTDTQINIKILICLQDWHCLLHEGGTSYLHKQGQTTATSKGESQWRYRLLGKECTDTLSLWAWNYINIRKTNRNQSRPPVLKEKKKGSEHCRVGSCSPSATLIGLWTSSLL